VLVAANNASRTMITVKALYVPKDTEFCVVRMYYFCVNL
jgi:hypothetical protein